MYEERHIFPAVTPDMRGDSLKNTCLSLSFCFALSGLIQTVTALCLYFAGGAPISLLVTSIIGGSFLFAALVLFISGRCQLRRKRDEFSL